MTSIRAFGGLTFADRMYMARIEIAGAPRLRVYEVEPKAVHVPDYGSHRGRQHHPMAKSRAVEVPRQERAWYGDAARRLCAPGFAAFGGTERLATEALLRVMREARDSGRMTGLGEAIRVVAESLRRAEHASRAAV